MFDRVAMNIKKEYDSLRTKKILDSKSNKKKKTSKKKNNNLSSTAAAESQA